VAIIFFKDEVIPLVKTDNKFCGYQPGESALHIANIRIKFLLALALIVATGTGNGLTLLSIALLCHVGMLISGVSVIKAWKRLGDFKIFLLVLGGLPLFLTPGNSIQMFEGITLPVTGEGLECGVFTVSRLALMIWVSMIMMWTTSPESLMRSISGSCSNVFPGSHSLREFVLVGVLAFQILPDLLAEAEEKLRGSVGHSKLEEKVSRFEIIKVKVQSLIAWALAVLAEPERLSRSYKKS
jgi:energy-coupling factor transport system permease protein|tara:strand:+ start:1931 stop:2650 length:720 start_codon:yes stop_codon:yes gene_type:complete